MVSRREFFWSHVDVRGPAECWRWKSNVNRDGYGIYGRQNSHRFAFEQCMGARIPPGKVVRHKCDNPPCCNPLHLELGTQGQNVQDRVDRGRGAAGQQNGRNVLTPSQVLVVCYNGLPATIAAQQLRVAPATVRDIRRGRIWGWLTGVNSHAPRPVPTRGPNDSSTDAVSR